MPAGTSPDIGAYEEQTILLSEDEQGKYKSQKLYKGYKTY